MLGAVVQWGLIATAVVAGFFGLSFLAARFFFVERYPDEVHFARTGDGWLIGVMRYRPATPRPGTPPVVLLPGIAMNGLVFDLDDDTSFARALAADGFDVWTVELRGRGYSSRPRLFSRYRYDWSFDEYVAHDTPTALDAVRKATGADRVFLVGYSIGGLIAYAYLGGDGKRRADVAAAVAIGAPATFTFQRRYLRFWPLRKLRWLRHRQLMRLFSPLVGYWQPNSVRLVHNPANIGGERMRRVMANLSANFGTLELWQYSDWIDNDVFRSIDHRRDYRKDLGRVDVPMLFVAGNKDLLAPMQGIKAAHDAVASEDKTFAVASRGQGHEANYGHLDLVLGQHAREDIVPLVRDFLRGRAAGGGRSDQAGEAEGKAAG